MSLQGEKDVILVMTKNNHPKNMASPKWEIQELEKDLLKVVKSAICQRLAIVKNLEIAL